jgi:hypothetical protein
MNKKDGSHDHQNPGEKRTVSGEVKVHGGLQVFESESAIEQRKAERKDGNAYKDATKGYENSSLVTFRITLVVTTLYFAVTCLIFWQSKRSADAAKNSVRIADATLKSSQQSFETDQRPYVVPDGVPYFTFDRKTTKPIFTNASIRLKNTGRTPAFDTFSASRFDRWDWGEMPRNVELLVAAEDRIFDNISETMRLYDTPAREAIKKVVLRQDMAPGANNYFTTNFLESPMPETDFPKLVAGDTVLIFVGIARYGGFGHEYRTDFCFFYAGDQPSVWHYCSHHNAIH